jgi:hypothetical protein
MDAPEIYAETDHLGEPFTRLGRHERSWGLFPATDAVQVILNRLEVVGDASKVTQQGDELRVTMTV